MCGIIKLIVTNLIGLLLCCFDKKNSLTI